MSHDSWRCSLFLFPKCILTFNTKWNVMFCLQRFYINVCHLDGHLILIPIHGFDVPLWLTLFLFIAADSSKHIKRTWKCYETCFSLFQRMKMNSQVSWIKLVSIGANGFIVKSYYVWTRILGKRMISFSLVRCLDERRPWNHTLRDDWKL